MLSQQRQRKADPVTYPLNVSLEDIYTGVQKKLKITAKRIVDSTGRTQPVASEKVISIKAGWKDGTKITYANEGDEAPGVLPADIVFVLKTKPHDRFERDGDDLICKVTITLYEALCGARLIVTTLDNR